MADYSGLWEKEEGLKKIKRQLRKTMEKESG